MDTAIRTLFARYERAFNAALAGAGAGMVADADLAALYAPAFIAASPQGVRAGQNDADFLRGMAEGYTHYRAIGTRDMRIRTLRVTPIDDAHAIAHVAWTARYLRDDLPETAIDFEVAYLVQLRAGAARVFGWITGDEQAALRAHGVI